MAKAKKFKNLTNKELKALLPKKGIFNPVIDQLIDTINDGRYWMVSFFNGSVIFTFDSQGHVKEKDHLTNDAVFCVYSELESGHWMEDTYSLQGELVGSKNGLYEKNNY